MRSSVRICQPRVLLEQFAPAPDDVSAVGLDDIVGAAEGLALIVGAGEMVGANDHDEVEQN